MPRRPLYERIYDDVRDRIGRGEWAPAEAIPPEMTLARDLGASQGTVRRALDMLCDEGALVRRQGLGTFVAEQTPERANFRFFRFSDADGSPVTPELHRQIAGTGPTGIAEALALGLIPGEDAYVIDRIRTVNGEKALLETVTVAKTVMPGLDTDPDLPNALYPHYQARYGVTVISTDEKISAAAATARQARQLSVDLGTPLLTVERIAKDLQGRRVEHRISHAVPQSLVFSITLS